MCDIESGVRFDADAVRIGLGIAIQAIDLMIKVEGDPTTALERMAIGLRLVSASIGEPL